MFASHTVASRRPAPAGFSLVEMLVALILLAVGLLGVAGAAASIARLRRDSVQRSLAASLAESRAELVRATACVPMAGDSIVGPLFERWIVLSLGHGVHELIDSIRSPGSPGRPPRTNEFRSAVPC